MRAGFFACLLLAYRSGKEEQLAYAILLPALSSARCFATTCQYELHLKTGALPGQPPLLRYSCSRVDAATTATFLSKGSFVIARYLLGFRASTSDMLHPGMCYKLRAHPALFL